VDHTKKIQKYPDRSEAPALLPDLISIKNENVITENGKIFDEQQFCFENVSVK